MGKSRWAQTGWATLAIDSQGVTWAKWRGPLPCELPIQRTIKTAELWAFYQALRHATPPCTIHADHKGIVEGIGRGKAWCVSTKRHRADIWRRSW
eukprot:7904543-Pyramimonas_sp.AAC.1